MSRILIRVTIWMMVLVLPATVAANTPATALPLLAEGKHISVILGFNDTQPPSTLASMQARWQEALAAGMTVGRI